MNAIGVERPIASTIMAVGGSGKERNLVYDPQEGIEEIIIPAKRSILNSKGIRVMTPREWGKLQGFINYAFVDENGIDHFRFQKAFQIHKNINNSGIL